MAQSGLHKLVCSVLCASMLVSGQARAQSPSRSGAVQTLQDALVQAYQTNPQLDAERARLRATEEEIARANAGWFPQVSGTAEIFKDNVNSRPASSSDGSQRRWSYGATVTQPIFRGFQTVNAVSEAEALAEAGRETLRNVEQQVLLEAVTAYADVLRDGSLVASYEQNTEALSGEVRAAQQRLSVQDVTLTDVAQAQARRARAESELDVARGTLDASLAEYQRVIGIPAGRLSEPSPGSPYLPSSLEEAKSLAVTSHPTVVAALYREAATRFAMDRIRGEMLPEVSLEASYSNEHDTASDYDRQRDARIGGRVTVPLFRGGETLARVRQASHLVASRAQEVADARARAQADAIASWSRLQSVRAKLDSDKTQLNATRTALGGVKQEQLAGKRTLLDVLNAEQEVLEAQIDLTSTRRDLVVAVFTVLASVGRLSLGQLTAGIAPPYEEAAAKAHPDQSTKVARVAPPSVEGPARSWVTSVAAHKVPEVPDQKRPAPKVPARKVAKAASPQQRPIKLRSTHLDETMPAPRSQTAKPARQSSTLRRSVW